MTINNETLVRNSDEKMRLKEQVLAEIEREIEEKVDKSKPIITGFKESKAELMNKSKAGRPKKEKQAFVIKEETAGAIAALRSNADSASMHVHPVNQPTCKVVDAPCGAGKTSAAINLINSAPEDTHFLFITPFLDEVERIKESCASKNFVEPDPSNGGSKTISITDLLAEGRNIVSTHALFRRLTDEALFHIQNNNYTLIMDEVTMVIEPLKITEHDKAILLKNMVHIDDEGFVIWDNAEYDGKYNAYKSLCETKNVMTSSENASWVWIFPIETFRAFRETYLLTYLFKAQQQRYYYDLHNVNYEFLYVYKNDSTGQYEFTPDVVNYHEEEFARLIKIIERPQLNAIGDNEHVLSKTWYENASRSQLDSIKKNTYNFFRRHSNTTSQFNIWTTFKSKENAIKGPGFSKGFVSVSARSTNKYKDTCAAAYLVNIFMNPNVVSFFRKYGIEVDEELYALSELIQWLWRTRVRDGKPIMVYIPSARMRGLLKTWLAGGVK